MQMQTNEIKVKAVIEQFNLFEINDKGFFSKRLNDHLKIRISMQEKGKVNAEKRWLKNGHPNGAPIGHPNAKKESKEINKGDFLTKIVL